MPNNRPKIKVPLEPIDLIVEIISISLLLILVIYTFMVYKNLPETIPTHFNYKGEADGFGNKSTMWLLPIIGIVMYVGFNILNRFPHIHNYMVNITEENALKNYRFSTRILRFVQLLIMVLFIYIQYTIVSHVNNKAETISNWTIPVILAISLILPIILIIYQYKMNK